jgi:hypothetical protein
MVQQGWVIILGLAFPFVALGLAHFRLGLGLACREGGRS